MKEEEYILISNLIRIKSVIELLCLVLPDEIIDINEHDAMLKKLWQWQYTTQNKIGVN